MTASFALHGRMSLIFSGGYECIRSRSLRSRIACNMGKKLIRNPSNALNSTANTIKNMQVPAYWPSFAGIQPTDHRGVAEEVKNVMAIDSADIMDDAMSMPAIAVDVAIDMPDMVAVAMSVMDIDISIVDMVTVEI